LTESKGDLNIDCRYDITTILESTKVQIRLQYL